MKNENWNPISTAPKSTILLLAGEIYNNENDYFIGYYCCPKKCWIDWADNEPFEGDPTHWMELPKLPTPPTNQP